MNLISLFSLFACISYVIFNDSSEHMAFLMTKYPEHVNDEMWLKNKQNETFPKWFKEKVLCEFNNSFVIFLQLPSSRESFYNLFIFFRLLQIWKTKKSY
jgi:hypothetical protein